MAERIPGQDPENINAKSQVYTDNSHRLVMGEGNLEANLPESSTSEGSSDGKSKAATTKASIEEEALFTIPLDWEVIEDQRDISPDQPVVYLNESITETSRRIQEACRKNRQVHEFLEDSLNEWRGEGDYNLYTKLCSHAMDVQKFLTICLASIPPSLRLPESEEGRKRGGGLDGVLTSARGVVRY